jgi:Tfp pilus assembly protein PilF
MDESLFNLGCNSAAIGNDILALKYFSKAYELNPKNGSAVKEMNNIKKRLGIVKL